MAPRKPSGRPGGKPNDDAGAAEIALEAEVPRDPDTGDMFGGANQPIVSAAAPRVVPHDITIQAAMPGSSPSTAGAKPYVVLARKYRPQTFDDLIGQEAMVTTLRNAFATGRIAQGYMLTGVRGIGKTTTARILARAFNYEATLPDGTHVDQASIDMPVLGRHCAEIIESRHPDVLEMDAASNTGVDNIRELIESARYRPIVARTKVYVIDEVHMLSKGAFNALLKTLEEPPPHVKFVFATTEIRKVPVTVLSRCQRFDLRRIDVPELARHLGRVAEQERARADPRALALISRAAEGSVRDGLSLLDQAIAMGAGEVAEVATRAMLGLADRGRVYDLLELLVSGQTAAALRGFEALHAAGADPLQTLVDLAEVVHVVTRARTLGVEAAGELLSPDERRRTGELAAVLSVPLLSRAWQMLLKGREETAGAPNQGAAAEMVLVRLAHTADLPSPGELIAALGGDAIARRGSGGAARAPATGDPASSGARSRPETTADQRRAAASPSMTEPATSTPAPVSGTTEDRDTPAVTPPWLDEPDDPGAREDDLAGDDHDETGGERLVARPQRHQIGDFTALLALVGERRDAKLKVHLEEHVSLVEFNADVDGTGVIELFLLSGAHKEMANELREKLNAWTDRRWMVALASRPGARPVGVVRREKEAADLVRLREHPAVAALLEAFPDAEIAAVRPLRKPEPDDEGGAAVDEGGEDAATG